MVRLNIASNNRLTSLCCLSLNSSYFDVFKVIKVTLSARIFRNR